jgi:NAD(P)-dependent dehydrogenase (short-subunit alcohol dehydrogenase family)
MNEPGRFVLISGASSGIGLDLARHLAGRGWHVLAGARRPEDLERLRALAPGQILPVALDVTSEASVRDAFSEIERATGAAGLQALINNAGIAVAGPVERVSIADWRAQFEVNLFGVVSLTQAFLPLLRRGRGRIVMMSSVSGLLSFPWLGAYCSSKQALEAMADSLRMELAGDGTYVTVVEPSAIRTPIWEKSERELAESGRADPSLGGGGYEAMGLRVADHMRRAAAGAVDASEVSSAVERILEARRPPARKRVGRGTLWACVFRLLPASWRDRQILRSLKG